MFLRLFAVTLGVSLFSVSILAGEPVKGKDCPDLGALFNRLEKMDQSKMKVALVDLKRQSSEPLSGPEADMIWHEYTLRNENPPLKIVGNAEQVGCKLLRGDGQGHSYEYPILSFTKDSVTLKHEGVPSPVTIRVKDGQIVTELTAGGPMSYSPQCFGGKNVEVIIHLRRTSALAWPVNGKIAELRTSAGFEKLAQEAKPIAAAFNRRCLPAGLPDGGASPSGTQGGSDGADGGVTSTR